MYYVIFDSFARAQRVRCGPIAWFRHWRLFRKAARH